MQETIVDLIRHGEPVGGRRYRGYGIDDPLSEKGWQQMWQAVAAHTPWDQIITSPLLRCQAFAAELAARHGIPLAQEPQFREVGFGVWEGRSREELQAQEAQAYGEFYDDPVNNRPAGSEPLVDFIDRVTTAYDRLVLRYAGQHCLVVAHAGVMRAIIAHVLGAPAPSLYRIQIANAAQCRIRHNERGGVLEMLGQ